MLFVNSIFKQYQDYLQENEGKLKQEDKKRYKEQYKNISSMVYLYDQERADDSQEVCTKFLFAFMIIFYVYIDTCFLCIFFR